jgi:hypothetical protein
MSLNKWIVDKDCDDYGNYTIRIDNGTINGDLSIKPIATVYNYINAMLIVESHNLIFPVQ